MRPVISFWRDRQRQIETDRERDRDRERYRDYAEISMQLLMVRLMLVFFFPFPSQVDAQGRTALHVASGAGNMDGARLLLQKGSPPNAR